MMKGIESMVSIVKSAFFSALSLNSLFIYVVSVQVELAPSTRKHLLSSKSHLNIFLADVPPQGGKCFFYAYRLLLDTALARLRLSLTRIKKRSKTSNLLPSSHSLNNMYFAARRASRSQLELFWQFTDKEQCY